MKTRNKEWYKKFDEMVKLKKEFNIESDKLFGMDFRIDGDNYLRQDERVYLLEVKLEKLDEQLSVGE